MGKNPEKEEKGIIVGIDFSINGVGEYSSFWIICITSFYTLKISTTVSTSLTFQLEKCGGFFAILWSIWFKDAQGITGKSEIVLWSFGTFVVNVWRQMLKTWGKASNTIYFHVYSQQFSFPLLILWVMEGGEFMLLHWRKSQLRWRILTYLQVLTDKTMISLCKSVSR